MTTTAPSFDSVACDGQEAAGLQVQGWHSRLTHSTAWYSWHLFSGWGCNVMMLQDSTTGLQLKVWGHSSWDQDQHAVMRANVHMHLLLSKIHELDSAS
jgi:hypothetical protein